MSNSFWDICALVIGASPLLLVGFTVLFASMDEHKVIKKLVKALMLLSSLPIIFSPLLLILFLEDEYNGIFLTGVMIVTCLAISIALFIVSRLRPKLFRYVPLLRLTSSFFIIAFLIYLIIVLVLFFCASIPDPIFSDVIIIGVFAIITFLLFIPFFVSLFPTFKSSIFFIPKRFVLYLYSFSDADEYPFSESKNSFKENTYLGLPILKIAPPTDVTNDNSIFLPSSNWKQPLEYYISRAEFIIIQMSNTPGLLWELSKIHMANNVFFYAPDNAIIKKLLTLPNNIIANNPIFPLLVEIQQHIDNQELPPKIIFSLSGEVFPDFNSHGIDGHPTKRKEPILTLEHKLSLCKTPNEKPKFKIHDCFRNVLRTIVYSLSIVWDWIADMIDDAEGSILTRILYGIGIAIFGVFSLGLLIFSVIWYLDNTLTVYQFILGLVLSGFMILLLYFSIKNNKNKW